MFTIQGSMIPFAETEAERQRVGDPRPSREARYASRDAWAARLTEATDRLVAERLLSGIALMRQKGRVEEGRISGPS
jgi:hypothetical protein